MTNHFILANEKELTEAFTEWRRRSRAAPEKFMSPTELAQTSPEALGALDARCLIEILEGTQTDARPTDSDEARSKSA